MCVPEEYKRYVDGWTDGCRRVIATLVQHPLKYMPVRLYPESVGSLFRGNLVWGRKPVSPVTRSSCTQKPRKLMGCPSKSDSFCELHHAQTVPGGSEPDIQIVLSHCFQLSARYPSMLQCRGAHVCCAIPDASKPVICTVRLAHNRTFASHAYSLALLPFPP